MLKSVTLMAVVSCELATDEEANACSSEVLIAASPFDFDTAVLV